MAAMKGATRYIGRQIGVAVLFIATALTLSIWLSQTLHFIDTIVNSSLPLGLTLEFLVLLIPSLLAVILPVAVFVGILFVYWKLTNDRELVVLQSAGMSPLEIARPALAIAVLATLVCYLLSLYLLPVSYRKFRDFETRIRNDFAQVLLPVGVFSNIGDGLTVYARDRDPGGVLLGLIVYDSREAERPVIYTAVRGLVSTTAMGPRLTMEEGTYHESDPKTQRTSILYFDHVAISISDLAGGAEQRTLSAWERFLPQLLDPVDLAPGDPMRKALLVEAHQRLLYPLYTLAYAVLGLAILAPAAASRPRQRATMLAASLAVIGLQVLNFTLRNVANGAPSLAPLMYLGPLVPLILGLLLLLHPARPGQRTALPLVPALGAR